MAYTPTTWTNGSGEPIDATNLNNIETGIDAAHVFLDAHYIGPVTSLPGSPTDKQRAILVDSLTAPTYQWLMQYASGISGARKWMCLGGTRKQGESSVTLPFAGDYDITWGVKISGDTDDTEFIATLTASSGSLTGLTTASIQAISGTSAIGLRGGGGGPAIVTGASASATLSIVMSGGNAANQDSGVAVIPRLL